MTAATVARGIVYPFRSVWKNRSLSASLVRREVLARSRGSFGGSLWTILNPLLLMATYFFVFGLVLKARFGNDPSPASFALYFLAGMLPWLAISEAVGRAPAVLHEHRTLIKRLIFPIETLPFNAVLSGLVNEGFAIVLYAVFFLLIKGYLPLSVLWFPVLLVPQILFTMGLCWFLAAAGAFFRDLIQINAFLLTIWFFITPICYPETQLPAAARPLLTRNPVYILARGWRAIFLENHAPDWRSLTVLTIVSLAMAILGHAFFHKLKKTFVEVL